MKALKEQRAASIPANANVRFSHVLHSEFLKLSSLRSTVGLLLAIIVFGLGVSVILGLTAESAGLPDRPSIGFMLDQVTIGTVLFGQLMAGVLGVLAISGEYSSGTMQTTLIAVPSRTVVLAAKAIVLFLTAAAAALLALLSSWAATYPMFAAFDVEIALTAVGVLPAVIGGAAYVGFSAVLGLGIGTSLRSVAAGVATVISTILLLPIVLSVLPASTLVRNLHLLTMSKAGDAMVSAADTSGSFLDLADGYVGVGAGWVIAAVWAGASLVIGAGLLRRRDA